MLASPFQKIAGLKACNFSKKRPQNRSFPVNIAKFSRTSIFKNIFERLLPTVRKYAVNDILQLLYEQPAIGIHNASMSIENSCQFPENSSRFIFGSKMTHTSELALSLECR